MLIFIRVFVKEVLVLLNLVFSFLLINAKWLVVHTLPYQIHFLVCGELF